MERYRFETDEHQLFRKTIRTFLKNEVEPYYEEWEENRLIPKSVWRKFGEMGFLCPHVDEQYGGLGLDFSYSVIILEELERVGTSLIGDRKSTRLNSSHVAISYAVFCLKKKKHKWPA